MTYNKYIIIIFSMIISVACFEGKSLKSKPGLLIPVGRLLNENSIRLYINSIRCKVDLVDDGNGSSWLKTPLKKINKKSKIKLVIYKTDPLNRLDEENIDVTKWTTGCSLIDSDNPDIVFLAKNITNGCNSNDEKVKKYWNTR